MGKSATNSGSGLALPHYSKIEVLDKANLNYFYMQTLSLRFFLVD
jgi:hypothetical protein